MLLEVDLKLRNSFSQLHAARKTYASTLILRTDQLKTDQLKDGLGLVGGEPRRLLMEQIEQQAELERVRGLELEAQSATGIGDGGND